MDAKEFKAWKAETESSKNRWTVDPVQLHNQKTFLAYKGGESGQYIMVNLNTGKAEIGDYEGAFPHIGEAWFTTKHERQFETLRGEALLTEVLERLGVAFLLQATRAI